MSDATIILEELLIALAGTAVVSVLISLVAWSFGFYTLPAESLIRKRTVQWWQVLGAFTVFLSAEVIILPSIYLLWVFISQGAISDEALKLDPTMQGWMNLAVIACSAGMLAVYCLWVDRNSIKAIWGAEACRKRWGSIVDFLIGAASWIVAYPWTGFISLFVAIALAFLYHGPHADQMAVKHLKGVMDTYWLFWATAVAIVLVVPVIEELMFRGFLQTWLKGVFGCGKAIIITSVIFALFHFSSSQGFDNLELIASLFVLSCFLGFVRERQQSLWASIGLHSTFNFLSILMLIHK
jgi:uncharacterized protein